MINELVGPLPEPPKAPKYPTPWKVIGTTIFAADDREVLTIAGTAAGLVPIIKDAVNAFVKPKPESGNFDYYREDYSSLPPDYYKVDQGVIVGFCDTLDNEEWIQFGEGDEPFYIGCKTSVEYDNLPAFLK